MAVKAKKIKKALRDANVDLTPAAWRRLKRMKHGPEPLSVLALRAQVQATVSAAGQHRLRDEALARREKARRSLLAGKPGPVVEPDLVGTTIDGKDDAP